MYLEEMLGLSQACGKKKKIISYFSLRCNPTIIWLKPLEYDFMTPFPVYHFGRACFRLLLIYSVSLVLFMKSCCRKVKSCCTVGHRC